MNSKRTTATILDIKLTLGALFLSFIVNSSILVHLFMSEDWIRRSKLPFQFLTGCIAIACAIAFVERYSKYKTMKKPD